MAKSAAKKTDIIPVEANKPSNGVDVIEAIPMDTPEEVLAKVEKEISTTLIKRNITDAILAELQVKYKDLKINGQEDKDGFEAVHEARMIIARTRVQITAICKNGRELATSIQKKWISTEKELIARISPEEDRLEKMEKDWTAEKERLKFEKLEMQKNRLRDRMKTLLAMGATSDGVDVSLDDISFSQTDIREADEEDWLSDIIPEYKKIFDAKETVRLAAEEKLAAEKKKQDDEKAEFQRQQDEFKKQQEDFENQKKAAELELRNSRISQLESIGMSPDYRNGDYVYETYRVDAAVLDTNADKAWRTILREAEAAITHMKKDAEEKNRLAEEKRLEDARLKAESELLVKNRELQLRSLGYSKNGIWWDTYKGRPIEKGYTGSLVTDHEIKCTDENWSVFITNATAYAQNEDKVIDQENKDRILKEENDRKEQERLRLEEENEKASDSVKWDAFINQVNALVLPTMKRQPYKDYVESASGFIKKINAIKR